jgi:hypothetical protein
MLVLQEELLKRKNAETLARITAQKDGAAAGGSGSAGRVISRVEAYKSPAEIPVIKHLQVSWI